MSKIRNISILCLFVLVLGIFADIRIGDIQEVSAAGNTYFVSPIGADTNAGTEAAPWKTLKKAATTLVAGDTAVFEDGVYDSSQIITFTNNGSSGAPITIKAKNKHQAKLTFIGLNATSKVILLNKQYIAIQDFEITQAVKGTSSADMFIDIRDCDNCLLSGNTIHGAGGKGIQGMKGDYVTVEKNEFYDINGTAVVLANMDRPVIANNDIHDIGSVGIMVAAGTRSAQIYNNYIHTSVTPMRFGIVLGGNYPASVAYDPSGFEAYNATAWNNIVVAEVPGNIESALAFAGSTNSGFYNNAVIDAKYGVRYINGGGSTAGWLPVTTSPKLMNNIFSGCTIGAQLVTNAPVGAMNDYNLYYNCANAPVETKGVYADPKFADRYSDWRLHADSPALGQGTVVNVTGFYGETMNVFLDYNGKPRSEPWHIGIYADAMPEVGTVLFNDNFENGANAWTVQLGNMSIVDDPLGVNKVYTQPDASAASGVARSFAGSTEWQSYQLDTRLKFNQFYHASGWVTLYTRFVDANNYYLLEMKGSPETGYIGLKKKVAGTVIPLQEKLGWQAPVGQWMDIQFVVNGSDIQVYINGQLELSGIDQQLTTGGIAAAIFRADAHIDDVQITEIDATSGPTDPGPRPAPGGTYYVSPTGSDLNPGTEMAPWKTLARAAELVQRGDTVIFEDGVYLETRPTIFAEGGNADERIVVKARNKHQAVIKFYNMPTTKILIKGTPYITLQDFEITQDTRGIDTNDIFVHVREGADHVNIIGNKIHNAYEEGVKGTQITDFLVEGNYIYDMTHEGIDFVNVSSSKIRNNEISDTARAGLIVKGGAYDVQIHNNYFHNRNVDMFLGAIYLGGQTNNISTLDYSVNGYEAWNVVAHNNVVVAEGTAKIDKGIIFMGSKDSAAYNNLIVGTKYGIYLESPGNMAPNVGWDWEPDNVNPVFKNNIIMNTTGEAVKLAGTKPPVNMVNDYNLYHNNAVTPVAVEPHGVYADPYIANLYGGDWHLMEGSPAIGAGTATPSFVLKNGQTIDISTDYDGIPRGVTWDQGLYRQGTYRSTERPITAIEVTGQSGVNNWYVGDATAALTAQSTDAPVAVTQFKLSVIESVYGVSQPSTDGFVRYTSPIVLTEGVYDLAYRSMDTLGNTEEDQTIRLSIDKTAPSLVLSANGSVLEEGMNLGDGEPYVFEALAADNLSGIAQVAITIDGIPYGGESLDFAGQPGTHTIVATTKDRAGNATEKSINFSIAVSLSSIEKLVERINELGSINHSLYVQLINSLQQAMKHMDNFLKHLDYSDQQDIPAETKQFLQQQAEMIIKH
ncbi:MAG: uncharacterized protein K0Q73_6522 [Paenibacillus sp.]|jgi:hypothetical protein|nr:uncharacterized protein [Paenibacillus sp.]